MTDEAKAAAFDAEANAVRPGWTLAGDEWNITGKSGEVITGGSGEVWRATIRGNIGLVWQLDGGFAWCWLVLNGAEPSKVLSKGLRHHRGLAMDACDNEVPKL